MPRLTNPTTRVVTLEAAVWALVGLLFLGGLVFQLSTRALLDPDEGRNAEIALEMARSGDFAVPTLEGLPFLDKPFLFFASGALAILALGPSELAVRLPSLLFYLGTLLLTFRFALHLFDRRTAWIALGMGATAPMSFVYAQAAIFDTMLGFFVVLALVAFFRAVEARADPTAGQGRRWTALAWLAMALGVFCKGPVAVAVPLLVAVPFAFWRRASRAIWHPAGWGLFLALVVPWLAAAEASVPGFLHYAVVTETWSRLTTDRMHRGGPLWYFLPILVGGAFPWSLVALFGSRWSGRARSAPGTVYLALWVALPVAFFSLSQSKLPHYILPVLPALAVLAARAWTGPAALRGLRAAALGWIVIAGVLLALAGGLVPIHSDGYRGIVDAATRAELTLALAALAAALAAWSLRSRGHGALLALASPLLLAPLLLHPLTDVLGRHRSARELAAVLEPILDGDGTVLGLETYSPSLSFHLDRPLLVLSSTGRALTSTYIENTYAQWAGAPGSPLRSPQPVSSLLRSCSPRDVFLLRPKHRRWQAELAAAGLPVLFQNDKLVAMGPCGRSQGNPRP